MKANVVNNLTTTASGKALDGRQGKSLNDKITSLTNTVNKLNNDYTTLKNDITKQDLLYSNNTGAKANEEIIIQSFMNYKMLAFVMCGGENISARSFTTVRVYNTAYLDSIKSSTTTDNSSNLISIRDNGTTIGSCWIISRTKIKMRAGGTSTTSCLIRLYGI